MSLVYMEGKSCKTRISGPAIKGQITPLRRDAFNSWMLLQVRQNLHMVFTASPVGANFRTRSQRFLATVNSTVIDWFQPWPESSLHRLALPSLPDSMLTSLQISAALSQTLSNACNMHVSDHCHCTPPPPLPSAPSPQCLPCCDSVPMIHSSSRLQKLACAWSRLNLVASATGNAAPHIAFANARQRDRQPAPFAELACTSGLTLKLVVQCGQEVPG